MAMVVLERIDRDFEAVVNQWLTADTLFLTLVKAQIWDGASQDRDRSLCPSIIKITPNLAIYIEEMLAT